MRWGHVPPVDWSLSLTGTLEWLLVPLIGTPEDHLSAGGCDRVKNLARGIPVNKKML